MRDEFRQAMGVQPGDHQNGRMLLMLPGDRNPHQVQHIHIVDNPDWQQYDSLLDITDETYRPSASTLQDSGRRKRSGREIRNEKGPMKKHPCLPQHPPDTMDEGVQTDEPSEALEPTGRLNRDAEPTGNPLAEQHIKLNALKALKLLQCQAVTSEQEMLFELLLLEFLHKLCQLGNVQVSLDTIVANSQQIFRRMNTLLRLTPTFLAHHPKTKYSSSARSKGNPSGLMGLEPDNNPLQHC